MNRIKKEIANNYRIDARDFRNRFDHLWEREPHKTGRIKSFTDLLMAFECVLKSHAVLSHKSNNPVEVYNVVRKCSHDISKLCDLASYLDDAEIYKYISSELSQFGVEIRYFMNSEASFFPFFEDWDNAPINYNKTIGNHSWVMNLREVLDNLIDPLAEEFGGLCEDTIVELLEHSEKMKKLYKDVGITFQCRRQPGPGEFDQ